MDKDNASMTNENGLENPNNPTTATTATTTTTTETDTDVSMLKTTTISTIAVQSGKTRIVIALLYVGDWIHLKIFEFIPELTSLGDNLAEALELQKTHDEVLQQLQSKQSPVEELLTQADQLIVSQKPRAEVYAAMAESLGCAWKDINKRLEIRKQLLELNVQYHIKAQEFFERHDQLESFCTDSVVSIKTDNVKNFLNSIHKLRRQLLESIMKALQIGNNLIGLLKEIEAKGTLDSRSEKNRISVNRAISQVQNWMEKLHLKRQIIETVFNKRKIQLEQCLTLAMLVTDLKELENLIQVRQNAITSNDQLGNSASSTEILLHEHIKLLPEAQQMQEKVLKITKATEQLLHSGCFASEEVTKQSYNILESSANYLEDLQKRENLLKRVIKFFQLSQTALTKLDQIEIQLTTSEFSFLSPQLMQLHSQCSLKIEEITKEPITEGHLILNKVGSDAKGVSKMVEELENKKLHLNSLCIAHREENIKINKKLNNFLEKFNELYEWLTGIAGAFLQSHQDMGNNLNSAKDFFDLHEQLLNDLQKKGNEINTLLLTLPPIVEYFDENNRKDIDSKVEKLHDRWMNLKGILENRLELSRIYVKFYMEADFVSNEMDTLQNSLQTNKNNINDDIMKELDYKWESLLPLYQSAKNTGLTFINQAEKVSEPYLNRKHACICVESVLERLSSRQLLEKKIWQSFQTEIVERREILVRLEETMAESVKTINWMTKLEVQLYPVLTSSNNLKDIIENLETKIKTILPDIKRAQNEVDQRIKTAETLINNSQTTEEKTLNIKNKLSEMNKKLIELIGEYQNLLEHFLNYFNNLFDLDKLVDKFNKPFISNESYNINIIDTLIKEHEASKQAILELFKKIQNECEKLVQKINKQEPHQAAEQDIQKVQHVFELQRNKWENQWKQKWDILESYRQLSQFDDDLNKINESLDDMTKQLNDVKGQYGESLSTAKATSQAFVYFEKTVDFLEQRIQAFVNTGEKLLAESHQQSLHIQRHILELQDRWNYVKKQVKDVRCLIDLSIPYFQLIKEANEWFHEGSRLLVTIAKKTTIVKTPDEAENLLKDIEIFLKPGEVKQNERIKKIIELAKQLYGPNYSDKINSVQKESQEMISSFSSIIDELKMLADNLRSTEEQKRNKLEEEQRRKQEEEQKRLNQIQEENENKRKQLEEIQRRKDEEEAQCKAEEEKRKQEELKRQQEEKRKQEFLRLQEEEEIRKKEEITQLKNGKTTPETTCLIFISPLTNAVIQEGSKFTFICQISGSPEPNITWYKDGICIQNNPDYHTTYENGLCTLTIEETFTEDSAKYTCKAHNSGGFAETEAILSVKEPEPKEQMSPPSFIKLLEPGVVKEGLNYQLICKVKGNPLPTVQWFKNQECIDNLTDYIITYNNGEAIVTLEKVTLLNKGEYTCKATNSLGIAQSTANLSVTTLEPMEEPKFIQPLSNVMARAGQKIKLECEVSGLPSPILTWSHNGKAVKETHELKLQFECNKATLVIYEAFPKDAGIYTVIAKNIAGELSSTCNVSVKGRLPTETSDSELASDMEPVKPSIQLPLTNVTVTEGERVRLDCVIVGQPEPEVIWYHNDQPVKESSDFQLLFQGDRCSLIIQEAFAEDAGNYKVVALNSAGEASSKCCLTVTTSIKTETTELSDNPPKFTKLLSDILVSEGEKVVFEGNVIGEPKPEVKWLLNNQLVSPNEHIKISHDNNGNIKLEIDSVQPSDKGVYTVKAINPSGESKCFAQLIVKSIKPADTVKHEEVKMAPIFKEFFNDTIAFEGTTTKFECIVFGKPTPKIKWLFNGEPIIGKKFLISTSGDRQVLTIPNLLKEDEGTITCVAENEVGKASCASKLSIQSESSSFNTDKEYQTVTSSSQLISTEVPQVEVHTYTSHDEKNIKQSNQEPTIVKELHKIEEIHQINQENHIITEKSTSSIIVGNTEMQKIEQKSKVRPPKFIVPVVGKIVDQKVNVTLEGILDGQPIPQVTWTKNGEELKSNDHIQINHSLNRVSVEIKEATTSDAGRYTCTATNEAGKAVNTVDLVVKKTIFPPVFGRRLQAQVIKKGDRIIMEVEVTGTPTPVITWFKDEIPIDDVFKNQYKLKSINNSHILTFDKADLNLNGRFMVKAVNSGGEAQSIADIAVYEPTPEKMVEVVKTVVFEDIKKHETLNKGNDKILSCPKMTSDTIQPVHCKSEDKTYSQFTTDKENISQMTSSKSEFTLMSEQNILKESQSFHMEHKMPEIPLPKHIEPILKHTDFEIIYPNTVQEVHKIEETGVETSSISKESSLQYFVKKIKQGDEPPAPKDVSMPEPIKPEIYRKFEDISQSENFSYKPSTIESKPISHVPLLIPKAPAEIDFKPETCFETSYSSKQSYESQTINQQHITKEELPKFYKPKSIVTLAEPSAEGIAMEKAWAHKFSEVHTEKSWPPLVQEETKITPSWSVQSTLEKKWSPISSSKSETSGPIKHYIAKVSSPEHLLNQLKVTESTSSQSQYFRSTGDSKEEYIIENCNVKPSQIVKIPSQPTHFSQPSIIKSVHIDTLPIRPVSVQDITDEVYLEPGPPPEISFAQPPIQESKQSYIETVELNFEKNLEKDQGRVPPGGIRTIPPPKIAPLPPPLPPKHEQPQAPPIPVKSYKSIPFKKSEVPPPSPKPTNFERFHDLEPSPFKSNIEKPKPVKVIPLPTPSKFIKGKFTDSDYESDFEAIKIPPTWKPCSSDTEDLVYRKVTAPTSKPVIRSKSVEPEPLPPSKFETPFQQEYSSHKVFESMHQSKIITNKSEEIKKEFYNEIKPSSPKGKHKKPIDGYMADTDEPFTQKKKFTKLEFEQDYKICSSEKYIEAPKRKFVPLKSFTLPASSTKKEFVATPIITKKFEKEQKQLYLEPSFPVKKFKDSPLKSPSKFVKGEFRESDYESDYEGKILPVWGSVNDPHFKPVRPILTPTIKTTQVGRTPTPPLPPKEFEKPHLESELSPKPKFEPIEKFKPNVKLDQILKPSPKVLIYKPKAVSPPVTLKPGSPPEIIYAPEPKKTQYYRSITSHPYHNAVQTETSNVMHINESSESCHRTVSVQQTTKVIKFGDEKKEESIRTHTSIPKKFVASESKSSNYECDLDSIKITPKWLPSGSNKENIWYRSVKAPTGTSIRSSSVPLSQERVLSPIKCEHISSKIDDTKKNLEYSDNQMITRSRSQEPYDLHPGTPPEYVYAPEQRITKKQATRIASDHLNSMTQTFKSKTQKFATDIVDDVNKKTLKSRSDKDAQIYKEETRASQYGTKHVDPDTGLIYFKYDFGYEFGIILSGESNKGALPMPQKTIIEPPKRTEDIEVPVYHEKTVTPQFRPKKFITNKNVKWEPTSESEMSEYEGEGKRKNNNLTGIKWWEQSSCSPVSLSPSLPSTSPAFNNTLPGIGKKGMETPPSCPSTPGSTKVYQNYGGQVKAPLFITPLRDIAVVSGQTAKFECIIQSEPPPNILWSKNGHIIENSNKYQIHYRNGVCRLKVSQAYPEDEGNYNCTASNPIGTASTTANLQVPGERRSTYIK